MGFKAQLILALVLNVALKLLTFTLNTLLTRLLHPHEIGLSFSYAVYVDSVLFIAREAVRNTTSRVNVYGGPSATADQDREARADTGDEKNPSERGGEDGTGTAPPSQGRTISPTAARQIVHLSFLAVPVALATMMLFESVPWLTGVCVLPSLSHTAARANRSQDWAAAPSTSVLPIGWLPLAVADRLPELLVWLSVLVSASVEPCVAAAQSVDLYRVVVLSEFVSLTARLVATVGFIKAVGPGGLASAYDARLVFAAGQAIYAAAHAAYCLIVCSRRLVWALPAAAQTALGASRELARVCRAAEAVGAEDAAPSPTHGLAPPPSPASPRQRRRYFPFPYGLCNPAASACAARTHVALLRPFFLESALRLVLTEGEGFALSTVGSARARGYFSLVSGLGSLAARLIFRVWENACMGRWGHHAAAGEWVAATALLIHMLRVALYLGLAVVLVGPPFAERFLHTLYASRWSSPAVVQALQLYCWAVPCMAWNGLLEAFVRATAAPSTLQRQQRAMLVQSLLYIVTCYVGLALFSGDDDGDSGSAVSFLILANIAGMLCRIAHACWLMARPTGAGGATVGPAALLSATPLPNMRLSLVLGSLLAASRLVRPSLSAISAMSVAYVTAVLVFDDPVRQTAQRLVGAVPNLRKRKAE